jgi:hypothetical protein
MNSICRTNRVVSYNLVIKYKQGEIFSFVEGKIFHVIPVAVPIPIKDDPAFCMMARTSAKSTLTNPGT